MDVGTVRIGLAVSDPDGLVATPLATVGLAGGEDPEAIARAIATALGDRRVAHVVVGLPRNLSGREGGAAKRARDIAAALTAHLEVGASLWDERFTSAEAERSLLAQDASRGRRREVRDRVAATLILQSFLDARAHGSVGGPPPGSGGGHGGDRR